jgi:hypothetical protein
MRIAYLIEPFALYGRVQSVSSGKRDFSGLREGSIARRRRVRAQGRRRVRAQD